MFFSEFYEIFKNIFFIEHLRGLLLLVVRITSAGIHILLVIKLSMNEFEFYLLENISKCASTNESFAYLN